MTRLTIVIIAAALLGAAALSVAHAQPPAQLSPPGQLSPPAEPSPTGSISGRIVFVGGHPRFREGGLNFWYAVFLLPADLSRPLDSYADVEFIFNHLVVADAEGYFSITGLADGEYFVLALARLDAATPSHETVVIVGASDRLGVRVTVADGNAVTGIELVVRVGQSPSPDPAVPGSDGGVTGEDGPPLSPPSQLSPALSLSAPDAGAGPSRTNGTTGRVAAGLAVAATLLLAGGVALRARGRRVLWHA